MMDLQVSCYTFRAEPSFINRKVIAGLNTHHMIVLDEQVHSALNSAIWAVSGHHTIDHSIRAPAIMRGVVEMRTIRLNDLLQVFDFTHDVLDLSVSLETPSQLLAASWHTRVRA